MNGSESSATKGIKKQIINLRSFTNHSDYLGQGLSEATSVEVIATQKLQNNKYIHFPIWYYAKRFSRYLVKPQVSRWLLRTNSQIISSFMLTSDDTLITMRPRTTTLKNKYWIHTFSDDTGLLLATFSDVLASNWDKIGLCDGPKEQKTYPQHWPCS